MKCTVLKQDSRITIGCNGITFEKNRLIQFIKINCLPQYIY